MGSRRYIPCGSIVAEDEKRREIIKKEEQTLKQWETKWGFLKDCYKVYHGELRKHNRHQLKRKIKAWDTPGVEINIPPSPPVPTTSSGVIGWRSFVPEYDLNVALGNLYVSPQKTLHEALHDKSDCKISDDESPTRVSTTFLIFV